ncbi:MAG TPA: hypothetical protein VHQ47_11405 [Phycisphaerae bacterium]|nr:hypothetical protein [Phycisphaerae bacterium]
MAQLSTPHPLSHTPDHPLVTRITRLRGRVRTVLSLFGLGILIAGGVGSLFILMLGDYLLHFSNTLRLLLLLAWIAALGFLAWRFLIAPLTTRLTDRFLASRVESAHRDLSDDLIAAVHFIHAGTMRTNALAARHVDLAAQKTESLRFEDAVDFQRPARALLVAAIITAIAGAVAAFNQPLAGIAFSRWFTTNPQAWPRITHASFDWDAMGGSDGKPPAALPIGEKITVRARVTRGGYPNQRMWLYSFVDGGRTSQDLMTFQKEQSSNGAYIYEHPLEPDGQKSLGLKLYVGDDTEQQPVIIRLAPRPVITELTASIQPPAYVKNVSDPAKPAPPVLTDLLTQAGRAVELSRITLRVRSTKPFATAGAGQPDVRLVDQTKDTDLPIALDKRLVDPTLAEISFTASKTLQARLVMRDTDGFESRVGGSFAIEVVPDTLPSVVITDPRRIVERTPTAIVDIADQATDDLGLDGHHLRADKFDAKPNDPAAFQTDLPWSDRTTDPASGNTTGKSTYTWDLAPMNLQPGMRFNFYAEVQDNFDVDGKRHPWVKSAPLVLQIRTEAEILESSRKSLNESKERLKALRGEQDQTRTMTEAIQKAIQTSGISTDQQKSQLADLARTESQETSTANAIQQRLAGVADDLRQNRMSDTDLGKLAAESSQGLKDVADTNMPKAASDLNKAHETAGNADAKDPNAKQQAQQTSDSAKSADNQQGEALAKMDNIINALGAAGDFEAARTALKQILDQQTQLAKETRDLSAKTTEKNPDDLPKDIKDRLERISAQQKDLANRTSDLMEQMQKSAQQLQQSDSATAQALSKAVDSGQQDQVVPSQSSASASVSKNQMASAGASQSQAQRGLQEMLDQLDQRSRLQLEQLSRQLDELIKLVQDLRDKEAGINKDTMIAGEKAAAAVFAKLGDRQGTNQMNAIVIQKKAESTPKAQAAAVDIRDAADQMGDAAGALYGNKEASAIPPEEKSIALLDEALKKLRALKADVDSQLKDKALAEFIKQYESIKQDQLTLKGVTDGIETRRQKAADKEIDRLGSLELAKQTTTQQNLIGRVADLTNDQQLKPFDVVIWMNGLVSDAMTTSRDDMKKAQTGKKLASAQQTAIDRLTDIIDALKDEQRRQSQFKSGGGGGGGGKPPLVPPLAQLKLLKAMQLVVNTQTTQVDNDLHAATPAEKSDLQQQAATLSRQQGEIQKIADKLAQQLQ